MRLCRTCASYYLERYGYCVLIGKRVQGWIGGRPCWKRREKMTNVEAHSLAVARTTQPLIGSLEGGE